MLYLPRTNLIFLDLMENNIT